MEPKKYSPRIEQLGFRMSRAVHAALDQPLSADLTDVVWSDSEDRDLFCALAEEIVTGLAKRTERVQ